jgi:hypothetical protein
MSKKSIKKIDLSAIEIALKKLIKEGCFTRLNEKYLN